MQESLERPHTNPTLAAKTGTNAKAVERLSERHVGETPHVYYLGLRLQRAAQLLRQAELRVKEIAAACGFVSSSHLAKHFRQRKGVNPLVYKNPSCP